MLLLSELKNKCDFLRVAKQDFCGVDRVVYAGRRGTGKSTAIKAYIAEGHSVIWLARSKARAETLPTLFVPPATRDILPAVEMVDGGEMPCFTFGGGVVRIVPYTLITAIRDTGVDVNGKQAEYIVSDEIIRPDGRYIRNEPHLIDDLAGTVGRSGDVPCIICACNPNPSDPNANPYAAAWFANFGVEGDYTHDGRKTRVIGTANCKDCFGKPIGFDPAPSDSWCAHLTSGGDVVSVNGQSIRVRWYRDWVYVGIAEGGEVLMKNNSYSPTANTARGSRFILACKQAHAEGVVLYDSFAAQMVFYALIRAK